MIEVVDDPRYPDRIGAVGAPLTPCKVTKIVATTAPSGRPRPDDVSMYDQVNQYRIRYELPPAPVAPGVSVDLDAAIRAKLAEARLNNWGTAVEAAVVAALDAHAEGDGHLCPAEVVGYTVMRWHDAHDPCPTKRAIAEKLGVGTS